MDDEVLEVPVYRPCSDLNYEHDYEDEDLYCPSLDEEEEEPLSVVPREEWGAVKPLHTIPLNHPVSQFIWAYTDSDECLTKEECCQAMRDLQRKNMEEQGMPDIQFNFYITKDGTVYEGRGWHSAASEVYPDYQEIIGDVFDVGYIGRIPPEDDPEAQDQYPSVDIMIVRDKLVEYGQEKRFLDEDLQCLPIVTGYKTIKRSEFAHVLGSDKHAYIDLQNEVSSKGMYSYMKECLKAVRPELVDW